MFTNTIIDTILRLYSTIIHLIFNAGALAGVLLVKSSRRRDLPKQKLKRMCTYLLNTPLYWYQMSPKYNEPLWQIR